MTPEQLAAKGLRVKELEWWEPSSKNNQTHGAACQFGTYYIHIDGGRHQAFLETFAAPFEVTCGPEVGRLYEAKAAAQADYEARVLAALVEVG